MDNAGSKSDSLEIERKFLVAGPLPDLSRCRRLEIRQAYIATDPIIRLRQLDEDYCLTIKGPGGMIHTEFEMALNEKQFRKLWKKVETGEVVKTRYEIPLDQFLLAELDVFHGRLKGFHIVEVEFPAVQAAESFSPPAWFGREVTDDKRYNNYSLAMEGLPEDGMSK